MNKRNKKELKKMVKSKNKKDFFINEFDRKYIGILTDEDVEKLKILKSFRLSYEYMSWKDLKMIIYAYSIENLMLIKRYSGKGIKWILSMIKKDLVFDEVIQLFKQYPIRIEFIQKMISSENYTLQQIEFLLKHNMIYWRFPYHKDFDYIELYDKITKLKLNPEEEYVNLLSIDIIKQLKKLYETEEHIKELYDKVVYYVDVKDCKQFFNLIALHELTLNETIALLIFISNNDYSFEKLNLLFDYYSKDEIFKKILSF